MNADKQKLVLESCKRSKIMQLFQAEIVDMADGYFEITLPKLAFTVRPGGIFNGSTISAAIDVAAGYAAVTAQEEDARFSTVSLNVNFLRPARGMQLIASGRVVRKGKSLTVVQVDVFTSDDDKKIEHNGGAAVATALVTLMQRRR